LAGISWVGYAARREGIALEKLFDLCFYIILGDILGARLFYALFEDRSILTHPLDFFKIWQGGLVFYGGLVGSVAVSIWYLRKHRLPFWKVADLFMPGLALGHAIGRLGCFCAGCCYGRPASEHFPFAVTFPHNPESLAPPGIPLYPTQLMESAAEFCIFLILAWFLKKKKFDGQVLLLYLILYSIVRITLEFFRGDMERGFVIGQTISFAQIIGFSLIVFAVIMWVIRSRGLRPQR
jgi:phosphatidylglycerol:prolipoprotein diacylglycerol transferase